ncbi:recombinase family protein, partial [Escherichia coli]
MGSCAAPSAKGDDKFITTDYLQQCRIGYIRVSTFDQNPERQLEGVKVDRAFSDKASGKDVKRPQLE